MDKVRVRILDYARSKLFYALHGNLVKVFFKQLMAFTCKQTSASKILYNDTKSASKMLTQDLWDESAMTWQ